MGIGCPNAVLQFETKKSLPVLNMIVIGFPSSGKTSLLKSISIDKD